MLLFTLWYGAVLGGFVLLNTVGEYWLQLFIAEVSVYIHSQGTLCSEVSDLLLKLKTQAV